MYDQTQPDICVIGAGPAGLATAIRSAANGKSVLLVESGDGSAALGDLCRGSVAPAVSASDREDATLVHGPSLYSQDYLETSRARTPGGSSTLWGIRADLSDNYRVRLVRPEPEDFLSDEAFDTPPWPVDTAELKHYLDEASEFFELPCTDGPPSFEESAFSFDSDKLSTAQFYFPKAELIHQRKISLADAHENVQLRTGWTLVRIETDRICEKITKLHFVDLNGEQIVVTPKVVVLAAGGIENSRVMLNAVDADQIRDPHDNLGRWFMDHPHVSLGVLEPKNDLEQLGKYHDFRSENGTTTLGSYQLTPEAAKSRNMLRFSITLVGAPRVIVSRAAASAAFLLNLKHERYSPGTIARHVGNVLSQPCNALRHYLHKKGETHSTALGGWSRQDTAIGKIDVVKVDSMMAQRPSRDNRIRLGDDRDRFGARHAHLQWSWSKLEVDSYFRSMDLISDEFQKVGAGKFVDARQLGCGTVPRGGTGWHQMGGTRMSSSPVEGVVNENCRHHQTENLYLSGSSIFPSSIGFANPTLSVVAMGLRLGAHLD